MVRQVHERATGRGMKFRNLGWEMKLVFHSDDTVLVAETREYLQHIENEFGRACDSMGLKINVGKSKALMVKKGSDGKL